MKAKLPQPVHESYLKHRKQMLWQIILPMVGASLLFLVMIALVYNATFNQSGDVARWAAISTMWIVIPVMATGLVILALVVGLIYLLGKLLGITPKYTGMAQDYVYKAEEYVKRATDLAVRPVLFLDGIGASIKTLLGRK